MLLGMDESRQRRFLGLTWGRWAPAAGSSRDREEFELLSRVADAEGVRWQDLTGEGYRTPGDLVVGGVPVRYDWRWRITELERRLRQARDDRRASHEN
jgi:hypothetical protein